MVKRKPKKSRTGTLADFADAAGISRPMVTKLRAMGVMEGAIIRQPGKKRVLVDIERALELYNERVDPNFRKATRFRAGTGNGPDNGKEKKERSGGQSYIDARSISEQYKAAKLKLDYEVNKNLWISRSEVSDLSFKAARLARDTLLNIPSRIAALVAAESDTNSCYQIIYKEIRDALDDFTKQLKKISKPKGEK